MAKKTQSEPVLHVYLNRSILVDETGGKHQFDEGKPTPEAKQRLAIVKDALEKGFLERLIAECQHPGASITNISDEHRKVIESLVKSITSEVGRAIVGLTILQLTVKSILPSQSIRLHKGSAGAEFSWKEGIPMRVLDKNYITPLLRKHNLLKLNADGFMMTRSLAENYPYSKLYKAAIRGAKQEWLDIADAIEKGNLDATSALKLMLVFLNNETEAFKLLSNRADLALAAFLERKPSFEQYLSTVSAFIEHSTYSARMFEVALHAFFQVLEEEKCLSGFLKPLSQMRSANKKHGNIGDIELTSVPGSMDILESWDAKFGKTYLRDELEELDDKLKNHPNVSIAGFVTNQKPNLKPEITQRMDELEFIHHTRIYMLELSEWLHFQISKYGLDEQRIGAKWLVAIAESICQKRRAIAPIDEPTAEWVADFIKHLD